ncbi:MAG: transglutaminase domain-containing protein [Eubacterium sp.]
MRNSEKTKDLRKRISITVLLAIVSVMMLIPQSAMTASAATAKTNKIHQANSVRIARSSKKKTSLKTPNTIKHVSFSKHGRIVYVRWNKPANTTGSVLYKVYYKIGSRSWKTRLTSSATVRIDVGYHQALRVKIRTYNRRGSTKKAGAVSSVFKTVTSPAGNSGSQEHPSTDPENNHSGSQDNSASQSSSDSQKDSSGTQDNSSTSGKAGENTHSQTPGVPSGISINGSSDGTVDVSWGEPDEDVTSYELDYKIGDDDWQTADVDIHGEYTLQTGYGKTVLIKVRALNGDKAGSWSAVKSYYMKPEYGYYDVSTDSVTVKIGETKTIPCKYVEGWKGQNFGCSGFYGLKVKLINNNNLEITGTKAVHAKAVLAQVGPSGRDDKVIDVNVRDPELDSKVDQIKEEMGIKDSSSDLMKAKLAADWLVKHTGYDYATFNSGDYSKADISIKHVLMDEHPLTICEGYAEAYTYILEDLNVPVKTISYSKGNHAWNVVKIDGNWYNVDTTWMDIGTICDYRWFMDSYQKLNELDTNHHHEYYNDSVLAQYRTDDTRFDSWTSSQWKNYTDSGSSLQDAA